jgi:uncharacterized protein YjiS (DUF1127 family)
MNEVGHNKGTPMSVTTVNAPAKAGAISRFFSNLVANYKRDALKRRTELELMQLSDRELADIGIYRGDISRIAQAHAEG